MFSFRENYPVGSSTFAVGMTGATMQIPNHYFRMSATVPLVCVRVCACPSGRLFEPAAKNKSASFGPRDAWYKHALNSANHSRDPRSASVNASCVLSALTFFRRSFDVHRSQLISGAREAPVHNDEPRPCFHDVRARSCYFSRVYFT